MRRRLILFWALVISCMMLSDTKEIYAGERGNEVTELFQLTLYADDSLATEQSGLDLSGIKIDVYSSELVGYDAEANGSTFAHNEFFSVYTDTDGKVEFVRPTEKILLLVDVSTLPRNTGIAISTKFYRESITRDRLAISKVDKIEIEKIETSEDEFYVNAYNREGTRINVDFTLSEINSEVSGNTKKICLEARVGDITEIGEYTIPFNETRGLEIQYVGDVEELFDYAGEEADEKADVPVETSQKGKMFIIGALVFLCFFMSLLLQ